MSLITKKVTISLSVFESFNIILIPSTSITNLVSNTSSMYIIQCIVLISIFLYKTLTVMSNKLIVEPILSVALRHFYIFIYSVIKQQLNIMKDLIVPHIFTIALVILCGNVCGLIPYGFSITSFPSITLVLSSLVFFSCVFLAILIPIYNIKSYSDLYKTKYLYFLSFFAPHDVPVWLYPLIILIEVISFFFRLVSLGFRLAANLMAGHILIGLLSSAYCGLLMSLGTSLIVVMIFTVVVCVLLLFELFVAFLQTYVFVVLLCSYYNDIYSHFDARF
jgi:F-type H+-transporting ATPase subunit a